VRTATLGTEPMNVPTALHELARLSSAVAATLAGLERLERAVGADPQILALVGSARIDAAELARRLGRIEAWVRDSATRVPRGLAG
jgi:hypothetical protein